jgi:YebC/PmpR family DNA-binding regulatory protein
MFARWNRMAKQFAKINKDITIAVRSGGSDPNSNPALRRVMQNARAVNMPKDKVEAAIRRASGADAKDYEVVIYEGYAPHGVAVIVEAATDNTKRTVASVRSIFSKHGGNLGTTGAVEFMFKRMGVFRLNPDGIDQDDLELYLIDHGLEEMGESTGEKGEPTTGRAVRVRRVRSRAESARRARLDADFSRARIRLHRTDDAAGRAGERSARTDRQARTGR